jgi:hypothetical protein
VLPCGTLHLVPCCHASRRATVALNLQMLGMNADALFRVFGGLLHFFEQVGFAIGELVGFISAQPPVDANGATARRGGAPLVFARW